MGVWKECKGEIVEKENFDEHSHTLVFEGWIHGLGTEPQWVMVFLLFKSLADSASSWKYEL